ncbi:MAG: hypothetical protein IPJ65_33305 [Archangiaceae bacterium]|nr:hypothetical protein [Archangiaceae bacterium]
MALLAGCPTENGPPDGSADAADAGLEAADSGAAQPPPVDAGPPAPAELPLSVTALSADGGAEQISHDIDPVKALSVRIPVPLSDYRLRVFDETDRVVPSDDLARDADGGIDYQISFEEPLKTGRTYRLTVEPQLGAQLEGFKDAELVMKVRGEVQADARKQPGKAKKKKR